MTPDLVRFFRHNGFVKLPARLPEERVAALRETIRREIADAVEPVQRDREGRVVRLSNVWGRGGIYREVFACPDVLDALEPLLGPNVELITNRHNHACLRLAGDGSAYMHRDVLQWTRTIVTVLFYLEETTVENGCTRVVPGTHLLWPGRESFPLAGDPAVEAAGLLEQAVPLPMPAGGLVAMDSLLFHGPGENRTAETRISLTAGYHSVDELSSVPNPARVLLRGRRIYHGNDMPKDEG